MATTITARRAGQDIRVLDISGDVPGGSETALMSAYGEAAGAKTVLLSNRDLPQRGRSAAGGIA